MNPYNPTALHMANPAGRAAAGGCHHHGLAVVLHLSAAAYRDDRRSGGARRAGPCKLRLTSTSVTNDFFIPQVAPMIDVMPGMRTMDAFQVNRPGNYRGLFRRFQRCRLLLDAVLHPHRLPGGFRRLGGQDPSRAKPALLRAIHQARAADGQCRRQACIFLPCRPEPVRAASTTPPSTGVVYPVPEEVNIPVAATDYTQGKNGND